MSKCKCVAPFPITVAAAAIRGQCNLFLSYRGWGRSLNNIFRLGNWIRVVLVSTVGWCVNIIWLCVCVCDWNPLIFKPVFYPWAKQHSYHKSIWLAVVGLYGSNSGKTKAAQTLCVCVCVRAHHTGVINSSKIKVSNIKHSLNAMPMKFSLWYVAIILHRHIYTKIVLHLQAFKHAYERIGGTQQTTVTKNLSITELKFKKY